MAIRTAKTIWEGDLKTGKGKINSLSGALEDVFYSYATRFESERGTNPEELIAAAHSSCFSMDLAARIEKAGFRPIQITTEDHVSLEKVENKTKITKIEVHTEAIIEEGLSEQEFLRIAEEAKVKCPVSSILTGTEIILHATMKTPEPAEHSNGN